MKTITLKADERFDTTLTNLAKSLKATKSSVIRTAVIDYKKKLEREALRARVYEASLKTRAQSYQVSKEMDDSYTDGL